MEIASAWTNQSSSLVGQKVGRVAMLAWALVAALAAAVIEAAEAADPDAPDVEAWVSVDMIQ